ncbi:hypothetical protein ABZ930_13365 [Streptomyces sp. NPDC046716]|uniref:hypothetical protein n=1 Tax=Streptomyces sp. NPDC046716 TaxID=3157093 RepID=UPI003401D9A7
MRPRTRLSALLGLSAMLLAGCGIRPTEVPTEFGAAPTRVGCALPRASGTEAPSAPPAGGEFAVQVYLVCTSQLVTVDRTVTLKRGQSSERAVVAQQLLAELSRRPSSDEAQAGFSTDVGTRLKVSGPAVGDPSDALRLSTPPDDLSPYALAQIVCTFANSKMTTEDGDHVVLGGPADDPLRDYECTDAVKARPGTIPAPARTVG